MSVDYNAFAKGFADSRKNMKWPEIEYFFSILSSDNILDIGCGSGRLLESYKNYFSKLPNAYVGVDLSSGLIDEAKKSYPKQSFHIGNMLEIDKYLGKELFENIFMIASFHHLDSLEKRQEMLDTLYERVEKGGKIYMTNWSLDSELNKQKYAESKISDSENQFGSSDFMIKIGSYKRYYHCFTEKELNYISQKAGFTVIENKLFSNERNIITILQK